MPWKSLTKWVNKRTCCDAWKSDLLFKSLELSLEYPQSSIWKWPLGIVWIACRYWWKLFFLLAVQYSGPQIRARNCSKISLQYSIFSMWVHDCSCSSSCWCRCHSKWFFTATSFFAGHFSNQIEDIHGSFFRFQNAQHNCCTSTLRLPHFLPDNFLSLRRSYFLQDVFRIK